MGENRGSPNVKLVNHISSYKKYNPNDKFSQGIAPNFGKLALKVMSS
jgi:hypothetical protein